MSVNYTNPVIPADEFQIKIGMRNTIFNETQQSLIQHTFILPTIEDTQHNTYRIQRTGNQIFSQIVPFNDPSIQIQIFAPKDAKIRFLSYWCYNSFFRYEESVDKFVCDEDFAKDQEKLEKEMKEEIQQQLIAYYHEEEKKLIERFEQIPYYKIHLFDDNIIELIPYCIESYNDLEPRESYQNCLVDMQEAFYPLQIEAKILEENLEFLTNEFSAVNISTQVDTMRNIRNNVKFCIQEYATYTEKDIFNICSERLRTHTNRNT